MPLPDKRSMKAKKAEDEKPADTGLSAVQKKFYEFAIAGVRKNLTQLKAHNDVLEEKNKELETKLKQMGTDTLDVNVFLNRTLNENISTIQGLEGELMKLKDVCREKTERLNESEERYKTMNDKLSSEVKSLTERLNSVRDCEGLELQLKEQAEKHRTILFETELRATLDKETLRKEVKNKLFELSTDFNQASNLRAPASTQRLLRENISLSNDMDRMMFTHKRLQRESQDMKKERSKAVEELDDSIIEKKRLMKINEQQLEIITKLTSKYEKLQALYDRRGYEIESLATKLKYCDLMSFEQNVQILEQHIQSIENDRQQLASDSTHYRKKYGKIFSILKTVRLTLKSTMKGDHDESDDPEFREHQRKSLLSNLMAIVKDFDESPERSSLKTVPFTGNLSRHADAEVAPACGAESTSKDTSLNKLDTSESKLSKDFNDVSEVAEVLSGPEDVLIDPISASSSYFSDIKSDSGSLSLVEKDSGTMLKNLIRKSQIQEAETSDKGSDAENDEKLLEKESLQSVDELGDESGEDEELLMNDQ